MEDKEKFMQAAGLVVGEPMSPEQMWLRGLIEDLERRLEELEQAGIEAEEGKTYTITAPICLSKGGLLDIAKVLNALPPEKKIRVKLDLSEATGLPYIAMGAFIGCKALESVKLPPSVTTIGDSAFSSCSNLSSVDIPEGVTTIGDYAFSSCDNLTSVNIPQGVIEIGHCAFSSLFCHNLRSVTFQKTDGWHLQDWWTKEIGEGINVSNPTDNATKLKDRRGHFCTEGLARKTES